MDHADFLLNKECGRERHPILWNDIPAIQRFTYAVNPQFAVDFLRFRPLAIVDAAPIFPILTDTRPPAVSRRNPKRPFQLHVPSGRHSHATHSIVVIGAGASGSTPSALLRSDRLRGSHIALVDRNSEALEPIANLAHHINREWDAQMTISQHTRHVDALYGARFVVSAIEVPPRETLWRSDFELTLKHGLRQPYAENGGPGGFAHALRNIGPVLEIARDMEEACPDAWYINYTNPMVRICDAITRYTRIKTVGLCHQIYEGYGIIGYLLADRLGIEVPPGRISSDADPGTSPTCMPSSNRPCRIEVRAAGLNHLPGCRTCTTGGRAKTSTRCCANACAVARLRAAHAARLDVFGLMPVPGDQHLCEYLPWLMTRPPSRGRSTASTSTTGKH